VAPGVEHIEIRRGDFTPGVPTDRWTIHVLILDPSRVRLELGLAMDEGVGVETVSSLAARHGALAAVNGGYFRTAGLFRGEPAGLRVFAGKVLSEPSRKRPGLAVTNLGGRVRLAVVGLDFRATVLGADGKEHAIAGVNRPRGKDEMILFTPEFHGTTLTGPDGAEAVVIGGLVVSLHDGQGSRPIPADGCVLSATGESREWLLRNLRPGWRVDVMTRAELAPAAAWEPDFIVGGGPFLVRDGRPAFASDPGGYDRGFSLDRHPRTAAGVRADGTLVLAAIDGRQPATSVGMTIPELEALMIELGCVEALNLDGGGSTTMVIRGKVVNSPSDPTGERPVSDALLVFVR
jgi:exopolysaccharide biosynthesis protein